MNFKKLLAAGTAAAMMAGASFTAFAAAPKVSGTEKAQKGEEVTYTITLAEGDKGLEATIATTGLEFKGVEGGVGANQSKAVLAKGFGETVTYTYVVTAEDAFSFKVDGILVADENNAPENHNAITINGTVEAAQETPVDPDQPADPDAPVVDPETPGTETPGTQTPAPGTTPEADGTQVEKPAEGKAPKTGDFGAVQLIKGLFR